MSPATNGIVIATEKKSSSILIDESMVDKVSVICPNIGIVYSGMGPDFRVLVAKARKSAQAYWKVYGEYPPARVLTQELANVMQQATQSGCVYMPGRCTYKILFEQWCSAIRRVPARRRLGRESWSELVPGRPFRFLLGMEGERDRQEHGQREDVPREAVCCVRIGMRVEH
jgi:hypothetical protein